jgi:hypothetical protein
LFIRNDINRTSSSFLLKYEIIFKHLQTIFHPHLVILEEKKTDVTYKDFIHFISNLFQYHEYKIITPFDFILQFLFLNEKKYKNTENN